MKYRIITNGSVYRVQYRRWWLWWRHISWETVNGWVIESKELDEVKRFVEDLEGFYRKIEEPTVEKKWTVVKPEVSKEFKRKLRWPKDSEETK